jgi:hypothetical protein
MGLAHLLDVPFGYTVSDPNRLTDTGNISTIWVTQPTSIDRSSSYSPPWRNQLLPNDEDVDEARLRATIRGTAPWN